MNSGRTLVQKTTKKAAPQKQKGIDYASYGRQGKLTNPYIKIDNRDSKIMNLFKSEELLKYEENFKFFDRNGCGYIIREDFALSIRALGFMVTTIEMNDIANHLDPEKTKKYNIQQYLTALSLVKDRKPQEQEIMKSLKIFDKRGQGKIDLNELKDIVTTLGDPVSQKEFLAVFGDLSKKTNSIDINLIANILMNIKKN